MSPNIHVNFLHLSVYAHNSLCSRVINGTLCVYDFMICLLILLDENEAEMAEKTADDEDDSGNSHDGDDDEGVITEIRFVPSDKAACEWPRGEWGSKFSQLCI